MGRPFPDIKTKSVVTIEKTGDAIPAEMSELYIGSPFFMPLKIDDYWLPVEPIITLVSNKLVVKTQMTGLRGSVKEEISTDDWIITIRGIVINDNENDYPYADITKLRLLCESLGSKRVVNRLLASFDINDIVIESYQWYTINALSDRPVELTLKEGL